MNAGINHYLETIRHPEGRFQTLKGIGFVRNARGEVDFQAGNSAVIFKTVSAAEKYAMKCYLKKDRNRGKRLKIVADYLNRLNSPHLSRFKYLDNEIYVFDDFGNGRFLPLTLANWVEGVSLRNWLSERCRGKDREAIEEMTGKFDRLALWLLEQAWAHGDLKPDNVVVTIENQLQLIDYDGVFLPEFSGNVSPELGTPGFQHPARDNTFYNRHLDDYSIALISTGLHALADFPEWYDETAEESWLFDPDDENDRLNRIKDHWVCAGKTTLYRLATLLSSPAPALPELPAILKQLPDHPDNQAVRPNEQPSLYRENGFYGYRDPAGSKITEAIYDDADPFREGVALVRIGKKRYYIGTEGKIRIDASKYDQAEPFSDGLAAVRKGRKWGYIDPGGTVSIPPAFEEARPFREGRAAVKRNGKYGYIDACGRCVIEARFDRAFDFREGTAVVGIGRRYGYIDLSGNWLIEPSYPFASGFRNGFAQAEKEGNTVRLAKKGDSITENTINL